MEILRQNVFQITLVDNEVVVFDNLICKLIKEYSKKAGFNKLLNAEEINLLRELDRTLETKE